MQGRLKKLLSISFVLGLIIALHYLGVLAPVERAVRSVINPLSSSVYSWNISTKTGIETFDSPEELAAAYEQLLLQYQDQQVDHAALERLQRDNAELLSQLEFFSSTTYQHVGARVIGQNIDPLGRSIMIDRGGLDGVKVDSPVVVGKGILVGLVSEVFDSTASVRLVDDNQSRIAATILNDDRSIGLVEGGFGISVQMNFIPQNEEISVGDTIITSGLTRNIPRGLVIGEVEAVEREAYQPFQRSLIAPSADLDKLYTVSVIIEE